MFEDRTDILREHIAYLEGLLSEESGNIEELDLEELQTFLDTCQEDIDSLTADLPYDEISEDDIPIEDFSGDNLDDTEVEDEIVEVEKVIEELQQLIESAKEHFLEQDNSTNTHDAAVFESSNLSEEAFYTRLEHWLAEALKEKCRNVGITKSEDEIIELRDRFIECAKANERDSYTLFSPGLYHITFEMIKQYQLLGSLMNFNNDLAFNYSFWNNVI